MGVRRSSSPEYMNQKQTRLDIKTSRHLLAGGSVLYLFVAFASIWLLIGGLGLYGLYALEANNQRMEKIVREHNVKIALATDLRNITRERALTVQIGRAHV